LFVDNDMPLLKICIENKATNNEYFVIQVMDHAYMQEGKNVTLLYIHYSELELQLNVYIVI